MVRVKSQLPSTDPKAIWGVADAIVQGAVIGAIARFVRIGAIATRGICFTPRVRQVQGSDQSHESTFFQQFHSAVPMCSHIAVVGDNYSVRIGISRQPLADDRRRPRPQPM